MCSTRRQWWCERTLRQQQGRMIPLTPLHRSTKMDICARMRLQSQRHHPTRVRSSAASDVYKGELQHLPAGEEPINLRMLVLPHRLLWSVQHLKEKVDLQTPQQTSWVLQVHQQQVPAITVAPLYRSNKMDL